MDLHYLHLLQLLLLLMLFCSVYHFTVRLPLKHYVPFCLLRAYPVYHPIYFRFQRCISRKHLYAFDKYQIWRYIERWKNSGNIPCVCIADMSILSKRSVISEYFSRTITRNHCLFLSVYRRLWDCNCTCDCDHPQPDDSSESEAAEIT